MHLNYFFNTYVGMDLGGYYRYVLHCGFNILHFTYKYKQFFSAFFI